jgi:hypothetical protein
MPNPLAHCVSNRADLASVRANVPFRRRSSENILAELIIVKAAAQRCVYLLQSASRQSADPIEEAMP